MFNGFRNGKNAKISACFAEILLPSYQIRNIVLYLFFASVLLSATGCHYTKHLGKNQYLLRKNSIKLKSEHPMANRGELMDNLAKIIVQKPNSYFFKAIPVKLSLYNKRYNKVHSRPDSSLPKKYERPVVYDSATLIRSAENMRGYLFNQGYFNAKVKDTVVFRKKKAFVIYSINAGTDYVINKIILKIGDSTIARLVKDNMNASLFQKGKEFTNGMADDERSRITAVIRNNGFYKFNQENVSFQLDTFDKAYFKDIESPFQAAVNYVEAPKKNKKRPQADIEYIIKLEDDSAAYQKFYIGKVNVFPDYSDKPADLADTNMKIRHISGIDFKYHHNFVHAWILYEHIFLYPGNHFSQADYDKTHSKLNELGIFQYIRLELKEDQKKKDTLNCNIYLTRSKRYDFGTNYEISSGSTYALGHQVGVNFKEKNFLKGSNLLTIGVNGGLEYAYQPGSTFINNFSILTRSYGAYASIDFPKFLAPIGAYLFSNSNLPHTIIGGGENVVDRVEYFKLINTSGNFSYSWHQSQTVTWNLSPVFVNIIRLPIETDSFKKVLDSNTYLRNSYKQNFIEGENISITFDDINKKHGRNYSYLKLGIEEAGGVLGAVNQLGDALNDLYKIQYAQYTKFDFDARHYLNVRHSVFAFRFYGGVGIPYGQSDALPYIKQYFAGGPYSLRGWRIRTLGPGSYYNAANANNTNQIDLTGDIKLELNGEYRFPITPLFAGAIKMNGALFFDAGNIWLTKKDVNYPGGEFELNTFGQDIAADAGIGARFDIASFLTVRTDVAIPVKEPYVGANYGWVTRQIDLYDPSWRANNVIFNISIGYPF